MDISVLSLQKRKYREALTVLSLIFNKDKKISRLDNLFKSRDMAIFIIKGQILVEGLESAQLNTLNICIIQPHCVALRI